jgi:hypothetical protein
MSRLESIKERAKITDNLNDDRADVNYLLQRLEIAHKALEQFSDESNWMGRGKETYPQRGIIEWDGEENPIKLAKEALKE